MTKSYIRGYDQVSITLWQRWWEVFLGEKITLRDEPLGVKHLNGFLSSDKLSSGIFWRFSAASALRFSISSLSLLFSSWDRRTKNMDIDTGFQPEGTSAGGEGALVPQKKERGSGLHATPSSRVVTGGETWAHESICLMLWRGHFPTGWTWPCHSSILCLSFLSVRQGQWEL